MAEKNAFNSINKDSMDINELASLNDDISPELIDQLQQKLTQDAQSMGEEKASKISPNFDVNDDTTLFEEPQVNETNTQEPQKPEHASEKKGFNLDKNFDDNFIKKYKAKLNKQQETGGKDKKEEPEDTISSAAFSSTIDNSENIEQITKGNISERAITQETVTSADESNSAGDSSTTDANASTEPVPDNISVNEMQAKIDELQQQIATKDEQIKQLEAGEAAENGGITFREFLTLYFRPDGNTYRLAEGRKIYSNSDCTQDYELDASNYTFSTTITLPFEGLNVQMLLTSDGQVVWSPDPYFERIDS